MLRLCRCVVITPLHHGIRRPSSQLMNMPVFAMVAVPVSCSTRIAPSSVDTAPSFSNISAYRGKGEGQVGRAWVGWGVGRGSTVGNVGAPLPPPPAPPKAPRPRSPVLGLAYLAVISVLLKPGCL